MSVNRKQLHDLIDAVDRSEFNILYHLLIKFVPEDMPTHEETEAIRIGREALSNGEYTSHEDINWN